jgi:hypothetical protein
MKIVAQAKPSSALAWICAQNNRAFANFAAANISQWREAIL